MVKVSVADGKLLVEPDVFGVVEEIALSASVEVGAFWKSMCVLQAIRLVLADQNSPQPSFNRGVASEQVLVDQRVCAPQ